LLTLSVQYGGKNTKLFKHTSKMNYRIEKDTMGEVKVPSERYWGAQTERSRNNFKIGPEGSMPIEVIHAYAVVKKAAAQTNADLGMLDSEKSVLISSVCDEIKNGLWDSEFPLVIWQTGSGTQTNMNVNEVIANRGHVIKGGKLTDPEKILSPNDDVNKSQSSNDTFPTAMHIAAYTSSVNKLVPALREMENILSLKSSEYDEIIKTGRTHFMDATPLTLGQEFSAYKHQVNQAIASIERSLLGVSELALGGTAVGTGLNAPDGFAVLAAKKIAEITGLPFVTAPNKFEALASHEALVELSSALKRTAIALMKIANDIRMLSSGPRSGIGELIIPDNEPGSSIMPGKVNPTQPEALSMVCARVIGNDLTVSLAASNGHFQLNVFKPVLIASILESINLLADASTSFTKNCLQGIKANKVTIAEHLENSLMLVTALNPRIGYYKSAEIAQLAHRENLTLRQAAVRSGYLSEDEFDRWVDPRKMV
jgi:fumarate hydratase, class II